MATGEGAAGPLLTGPPPPSGTPFDEARATWGLQVTGAAAARYTGRDVRVAVLDTGIAAGHPDLAGRVVDAQAASFLSQVVTPGSAAAADRHGHGTHCAGTVCGQARPVGGGPRYGVAPDARLYVGKVLGDDGIGYDDDFVAALNWAVANGCRVVSMSLGGEPGATYDPAFEEIARRALEAGTLIVAAAGNESGRATGRVAPVAHPANCPSVLAVAALDPAGGIADFSNRGLYPDGGQIDIAGPGVDVLSSYPADGYAYLSGTSMATPHVAGVAALHAEADPGATGKDLWGILIRTARRLELMSVDVGAGLVQAP